MRKHTKWILLADWKIFRRRTENGWEIRPYRRGRTFYSWGVQFIEDKDHVLNPMIYPWPNKKE